MPLSSRNGFTFIELLVVMAIMGLALSIVAPSLFNYVAKMEARDEVKRARQILGNVGIASCVSQVPRSVKLAGNELSILPDARVFRFKRIAFPDDAELHYNRRGLCNKDSVRVRVGNNLSNIRTYNNELGE